MFTKAGIDKSPIFNNIQVFRESLAGLYAGNPKRETDRPTAERLLEAFQDSTLTIIQGPQQTDRHVTALRPLQQRILEILGFSSALYTRLCTVSSEPP